MNKRILIIAAVAGLFFGNIAEARPNHGGRHDRPGRPPVRHHADRPVHHAGRPPLPPPHRPHDHADGVRLAADIVTLVGATLDIIAPAPVVVQPAAPVVVQPAAPVVVQPAPATVVQPARVFRFW